ncbi:NAD(P)H-dependent oxidoreductase [Chryseobacterium vrystaatense]|uniref:Modulator of drug activity B n=1 Tax=Chryseobacterium vrystaatense TaxID=307480 RepID=A0A1M5A6G1_9FLAO|nr:NAD(P)H-dependent oxidoreductase [Chryseobacterium vrystaatense]SHF25717.1 modulator of drug activity B [Chryseobacterium vrystaatense]
MKSRILLLLLVIALTAQTKIVAQIRLENKSAKEKTVLLINSHLTYPGMSEGKLNASFYNVAKAFFISNNYKVLETKIQEGYSIEEEVEKHLQADIIILHTPVNWENTPWIYKKYVDEVFTSALKSQKFLSGDGRSSEDPTKQYGTGGKMQGKKFMISATWNAPKESFNDPEQNLWKGKTADDALFNIAANYLFIGFDVVPGYYCYDIFHNKHIKEDLENYPDHLKKVFIL